MKINSIRTSAFQGARQVDLRLDAPVALVCGGNGQGKSSIRDAVVLALTGDTVRVKQKRDFGLMITEGYQAALAEVVADGEIYTAALNKAGKLTHSHKSKDGDSRLPFVLDAQRFARLTVEQRRAFAFSVLGVAHDHAAIARRLRDRGLDKDRVAQVENFLRVGFDAAFEEAKRGAAEARAAWKAETGETYGSLKGAAWRAPEPDTAGVDLEKLRAELVELDAELAEANKDSGGLIATQRIVDEARATIAALADKMQSASRLRDKLAADEAGLSEAARNHDAAAASAAAAPRVGLVHDLARSLDWALAALREATGEGIDKANAALNAYEVAHGPLADEAKGDPSAAARLPELRAAVDLMTRAVANAKRDLAAAEGAAAEVTRLQTLISDNPVDAEALQDARDNIAALTAQREDAMQRLRAAEKAAADSEAATQRTDRAAKQHLLVASWDAIAAALAPDGIQAEILGESMKPLNDRLAQSAVDTGWPMVFVRHDMAINAAGRPYELLSLSEQWRCDAMLAEAVSHLSGLRLLMLDGMDILEPVARPSLLAWLDVLAINGEVETALVFATLKAMPQGLPDSIQAWEVATGRCGEPEAVAA